MPITSEEEWNYSQSTRIACQAALRVGGLSGRRDSLFASSGSVEATRPQKPSMPGRPRPCLPHRLCCSHSSPCSSQSLQLGFVRQEFTCCQTWALVQAVAKPHTESAHDDALDLNSSGQQQEDFIHLSTSMDVSFGPQLLLILRQPRLGAFFGNPSEMCWP